MTNATERKETAPVKGKAAIIKMHVRELRNGQRRTKRVATAKVQNFFAGPHCTFLPHVETFLF